jgi:hypothetical protein
LVCCLFAIDAREEAATRDLIAWNGTPGNEAELGVDRLSKGGSRRRLGGEQARARGELAGLLRAALR